MTHGNKLIHLLAAAVLVASCSGSKKSTIDDAAGPDYPPCGSGVYDGRYLIPGPGEEGYDAELGRLAFDYERQFHLFNAAPMGVDTTAQVFFDNPDKRDLVEKFLREQSGWDFETFSGGVRPEEAIDGWFKVAGLYGGMGVVADALRYRTLSEQGADCAEIERARVHLTASLESTILALKISGKPGVVARGYVRTDIPGFASSVATIDLFDENGDPLPAEKDNGTWRADGSGLYPNYVWEDSCSRDMMLGWAAAVGVGAEIIRDDPTFPQSIKNELRDNSRAIIEEFRKVRDSGYDLEFPDADGRTTFHGYLNEHSIERDAYSPDFKNGFYALMTLGIVGAFAYAADDDDSRTYLYQELIAERGLPEIARDAMIYINMEEFTNFSNYSMAFTSAWLAMRFVEGAEAREAIRRAINVELYDSPGKRFQPVEQGMSLYDFVYIDANLDGSVYQPPTGEVDEDAYDRAMITLHGFDRPPYWSRRVELCDADELASGLCDFGNGTTTPVYDGGGRKGSTVCEEVVPKDIRRPSNYEWRSNPYEPNGGDGGDGLLSGVDFRIAYWTGRATRLPVLSASGE